MFKKLILSGVVILGLSGCATHSNENDRTVTEHFVITQIDSENFVHGEIIPNKNNQTGEGIFYSKKMLESSGLKDVYEGERISITWSKTDYDHENWNDFIAEEY
jgi:hypothetical protein